MLSVRGRRRAGAQGCDCNAMVVGSIPTKGTELLFINIFISLLSISRQKARRWVPPFNTQCLEKIGWNWITECLNTRFPLPILLCAWHKVEKKNCNLIFISLFHLPCKFVWNLVSSIWPISQCQIELKFGLRLQFWRQYN